MFYPWTRDRVLLHILVVEKGSSNSLVLINNNLMKESHYESGFEIHSTHWRSLLRLNDVWIIIRIFHPEAKYKLKQKCSINRCEDPRPCENYGNYWPNHNYKWRTKSIQIIEVSKWQYDKQFSNLFSDFVISIKNFANQSTFSSEESFKGSSMKLNSCSLSLLLSNENL